MELDDFDPDLPYIEGSEIEATVDISIKGTDGVDRPVFIGQDDELLHLTLEDAERLNEFLTEAIKFIKNFNGRILQ